MITSTHYLTPLKYIISRYIYEYDMSKANISVLYSGGIITKKEYDYYYDLPKSIREKEIGIRRKDKEFDKILSDLIQQYRIKFLEANNIDDNKIVAIKNDAIFILDNEASITKFDNVEFIKKNVYTSYINLNRLEIYYNLDNINDIETIDVKGISDEKLELHQDYFLNFICTIIDYIQSKPINDVLREITVFMSNYMKRYLELGYYREFNSSSQYTIYGAEFKFDMIDPKYINVLDISYNLNLLRELYNICCLLYLNK